MADTPVTSTQQTSTLPSHVVTLTMVAQVVGYLLTALGGILTTYATLHAQALWPELLVAVTGVLLVVCSHYGYVRGQATTQNALVNALLAAGTPIAMELLTRLLLKPGTDLGATVNSVPLTPLPSALKSTIVTGGAASSKSP